MSYQHARTFRIGKKFSFSLSVEDFRQRLWEAENETFKSIPVATFFLRDVVDAKGRKHAKASVDVTVRIVKAITHDGRATRNTVVRVSFSLAKVTFFCNFIFRLVSNDGDEILSSPETGFRDIDTTYHNFDVPRKPLLFGSFFGAMKHDPYVYGQFHSDIVKVQLDLEVAWHETSAAKDTPSPPSPTLSCPTAFDDLKKLFQDGKFADTIIICEEEIFFVSKLLLCARSEVFKAMLTGDTKEAKTNRIEIKEGVAHEIMALFLNFLVTDEVVKEDLEEHAIELLAVADMYMVKRLRSVCEATIQKGVNAQNCAECLVLADRSSIRNSFDVRAKSWFTTL